MKNKLLLKPVVLLAGLLIFLFGITAAESEAASTAYWNLAAWEAATTGELLLEDFEAGGNFTNPSVFRITHDGTPGPYGWGSGGISWHQSNTHGWWFWLDDPVTSITRSDGKATYWSSTEQQLHFSPGITAFGAEFDLSSTGSFGAWGSGAGITVAYNEGGSEFFNLSPGTFNGFNFWGFVAQSGLTISTIELTEGTGNVGGGEHGWIDNVRVSQVPIPAATWLVGIGLLGIVGVRRKLSK